MTNLRLLLLEDNALDAELTTAALTDGGFDCTVTRVDTRDAFVAALDADGGTAHDLILADHQLPAFDGLAALHLARERRPDLPFIFLSGTLGEEVAIEAMKHGATDYVFKHRLARLVPAVGRALRESAERRELARTSGALRAMEERCRLIVENATDFAIVMTDEQGVIRSWNPGAVQVFGAGERDAVGRPLDAFFTPEDRADGVLWRELDEAARDGRAADDRWLARADGTRFWASGVTNALRDGPRGPLLGFLKIVRDVTEMKRNEESLRRRNDRLKLLSETATYLLSTRDDRRIVADLFDKLSAHLGLEVYVAYLADEDDRTLRLMASQNLPPEATAAMDQTPVGGERICGIVAARGEPIVCEDVQRRPDDPRTAHVRALGVAAYACYPLVADGRLIGTLSMGTRTRPTFTPDELELMQTVVDQIAAALDRAHLLTREKKARADAEAATEVAVAANRAKDEFLATVSHELRTPLTAILGWARMLRHDDLDAETLGEAVDTIERNAKVQAQLIDDILDISRIISGKLRLNVEPTRLDRVVQDAADTLRPAAAARGITMSVSADRDAVVSGDADRLQQVVWNLLSNAIKFTPRGGRVTLAAERDRGGRCRIVVVDTGKGITPAFLPHVFDRFRQADASSTRRHGGLGLGLAIVRHLVELHGGTIEARSDGEGKGSTFVVYLPLAAGPAAGAAADDDAEPATAGLRAASGIGASTATVTAGSQQPLHQFDCPPTLDGLRVLVVDDEPDTRRLLSTVLQKCRATVASAASAAEALDAVGTFRPDVLLSDIGMPDEDGYSLIRRLREREDSLAASLPAIALTAYTRVEDRNRALAEGFHLYVTKPVEPSALVQAVAEAAGRERNRAPAAG